MKKITVVLTLSAVLCWSASGFSQDNTATATPDEAEQQEVLSLRAPLFTMETNEEDSPGLVQKKAALRLFKAYSVTVGRINTCRIKTPTESSDAMTSFTKLNGTTIGVIMSTIKRLGGFNKEIKTALDTAVSSEVMVGVSNCQAFCAEVMAGKYSIYTGPEYAEDYATMRRTVTED